MKRKVEMERFQREQVFNNKMLGERQHEEQMKRKIESLTEKQQKSIQAYQEHLFKKVKAAKETNRRMDSVARKAKEVEDEKVQKKYEEFK